MSNYETDHNITATTSEDTRRHTLSSAIESFMSSSSGSNPLSEFTNALRILSREQGSELASRLIESLENDFRDLDGEKTRGAPQDLIDNLPRVSVKDLPDKDADCPICTTRFADDEYPLVVQLPCNLKKGGKAHMFDLECIGPWLQMNSTCPLCRFDVLDAARMRRERLEEELRGLREGESEEEWDDTY